MPGWLLRRRFCDDEHGPGREKAGPISYAKFHHVGDDEALAQAQYYASGLVQALLTQIEERRQLLQE